MADKETEKNADPFAGFVSEAFKDGEAISPAADDPAVVADASKPAAKPDVDDSMEAAKEPAKEAAADDSAEGAEADENEDSVGESGETKADKEEDAEAAKEAAKPKPKLTAEQRINQLTRRLRATERERDSLKGRRETPPEDAEEEETPLTEDKPARKEAGKRPDPKDYTYGQLDDKYIADVVKHETDKALAAHDAAQKQSRQEQAAAQKAREFNKQLKTLHESGASAFDDFDDVVVEAGKAGEYDLSQLTLEMAAESEVGHKVLYHLATHPEEATAIYSSSSVKQAAAFGRLEAKFSAPAAQKSPKQDAPPLQPPPKQPRGAGGKFAITPDTTDFEAFEKLANAELRRS